MKKKLFSILLLAGTLMAGESCIAVRGGHRYGPPPPPPQSHRYMSARPGPGYVWIAGYYYPAGSSYRWHEGYWTRPPNKGDHWVAPGYRDGHYHEGHWRH
jgi:WXXGXW repeat (2 copies)